MKLEFLETGSPDCPLIRLYAFDSAEVLHFRAIIHSFSDGTCKRYDLHHDRNIEALGGCRLTFQLHDRDLGIVRRAQSTFDCVFTMEGWRQIEGLLGPFCESATPGHYQWLTDKGDASLLLSPDGSW
jgi:hypothetical protein